jgi:hypothetical protein
VNGELKGRGRKRSRPNLRRYSGICLGGLRKNAKNLSHDSQFWGQDLKPESSDTKQEC